MNADFDENSVGAGDDCIKVGWLQIVGHAVQMLKYVFEPQSKLNDYKRNIITDL